MTFSSNWLFSVFIFLREFDTERSFSTKKRKRCSKFLSVLHTIRLKISSQAFPYGYENLDNLLILKINKRARSNEFSSFQNQPPNYFVARLIRRCFTNEPANVRSLKVTIPFIRQFSLDLLRYLARGRFRWRAASSGRNRKQRNACHKQIRKCSF